MDDEKNYQNYLKKIKLFQKYNKHYYNLSEPIVKDYEFDKLKLEIIKYEKQNNFTIHKDSPSYSVGFKPSKIFKKANIENETNIVSNGLLLTEKISSALLSEKNFKVLGISIDEIGGANRGFKTGQWDLLTNNILNFKKKRDRLNHDCAIDIKTVVLEENIKDLSSMSKFVFENLKADTHSIQLLKGAEIQHSDLMFDYQKIHTKYKAYKYKNFNLLIDELEKIREYNLKNNKKAYLHPNVIPLNSENKINYDQYSFLNNENHDSNNYDTCYSPWTSVHVNVDGNLFPCMAVSMGNVKKDTLKKIIFSDIFKKFKDEIRNNKTINGCNRCGWLKCKKF